MQATTKQATPKQAKQESLAQHATRHQLDKNNHATSKESDNTQADGKQTTVRLVACQWARQWRRACGVAGRGCGLPLHTEALANVANDSARALPGVRFVGDLKSSV